MCCQILNFQKWKICNMNIAQSTGIWTKRTICDCTHWNWCLFLSFFILVSKTNSWTVPREKKKFVIRCYKRAKVRYSVERKREKWFRYALKSHGVSSGLRLSFQRSPPFNDRKTITTATYLCWQFLLFSFHVEITGYCFCHIRNKHETIWQIFN